MTLSLPDPGPIRQNVVFREFQNFLISLALKSLATKTQGLDLDTAVFQISPRTNSLFFDLHDFFLSMKHSFLLELPFCLSYSPRHKKNAPSNFY